MARRMSSLKWSEVAADDLQRIAEHIRAYSPKLEQTTISFIIDRADVLRKYPRIGRPWEVAIADVELRTILAGKRYRFIYQVNAQDDVEILQVLDVRSDNH